MAIDPKTGGVLALVSKPGYDPNPFVEGISGALYRQLRDDPERHLYNRALRGLYPPGSTIKPFVALAGLEMGAVSAGQNKFCPGFYRLPGQSHRYRDWKKGGHGSVDLNRAIVESCDVYFYDLAHDLGIDRLHKFLSGFSFGRKTGIDLTEELGGTAVAGMEGAGAAPAVVPGRDPHRRHRPGLPAGHAAVARGRHGDPGERRALRRAARRGGRGGARRLEQAAAWARFESRLPERASATRQRLEQVAACAPILGHEIHSKFPFHEGVRPVSEDVTQLLLNRTWKPALAITGAAGLPALENAGNVMRPATAVKVSLRLPPTCDAGIAAERLKVLFEQDPPYGARVRFQLGQSAAGWAAPEVSRWLAQSLDQASREYFGAESAFMARADRSRS